MLLTSTRDLTLPTNPHMLSLHYFKVLGKLSRFVYDSQNGRVQLLPEMCHTTVLELRYELPIRRDGYR